MEVGEDPAAGSTSGSEGPPAGTGVVEVSEVMGGSTSTTGTPDRPRAPLPGEHPRAEAWGAARGDDEIDGLVVRGTLAEATSEARTRP